MDVGSKSWCYCEVSGLCDCVGGEQEEKWAWRIWTNGFFSSAFSQEERGQGAWCFGEKMPLCVKIYLFRWDWVSHQAALGWTHTGAASIILWWCLLTAWAGGAKKVTEIHISVSMHAEDTCWLCEVHRDRNSFCLIYLWVSVAPPLYIGAASGQSEKLIFRFSWSQKLLSHHQI